MLLRLLVVYATIEIGGIQYHGYNHFHDNFACFGMIDTQVESVPREVDVWQESVFYNQHMSSSISFCHEEYLSNVLKF
jgi:hypothetical protein